MIRQLWLLVILLLGVPHLPGHPLTDMVIELRRVPDGLVLTLRHTLSEVFYIEELTWDYGEDEDGGEGMQFATKILGDGLAAFRQRVADGIVIYHRDGGMLRGTLQQVEGSVPKDPVLLNDLSLHDFAIHLHFANPAVEQDLETITFDFQSWRLNISTIITCTYIDNPTIAHPVLWDERGLYPLFPSSTETAMVANRQVLVVPSLNNRGIGFSTISLESDHFRHEVLLPVSTALELVDWPDEQPAAHDALDDQQRDHIAQALLQHSKDGTLVSDDDRGLRPQTQRVRWFDRASLRRGLPLDKQPVPVATGFVGLVEIFRPPPGTTLAIDHQLWLNLAPNLAFTARRGDTVLQRRTGRALREPWRVEQAAPPAMPPALAFVAPTPQLPWVIWGLAASAVLALILWPRGRPLALPVAVGWLIVQALLPERQPALDQHRIEQQLRYAYQSASGTDERRGLTMLQAVCTPELAAQLHVESRRRLAGPWAVRSGLDIETISLDQVKPASSHQARAQWTVRCRIRHWGHGHDRSVRFAGLLGFADDGRLASIELLDKQLTSAASARLD